MILHNCNTKITLCNHETVEKLHICEKCYKMIHDVKNNPKHKKENIDLFVPIDLKCPEHPKDRINLFCLDDRGNYFFN